MYHAVPAELTPLKTVRARLNIWKESCRAQRVTSVSEELRAAREEAGLSLADISARTKIKVSMLQAIETGDFDRLPGPFFTRAFIRSYARELRLPADEIVKLYVTTVEPPAPDPPPQPSPAAELPEWMASLAQWAAQLPSWLANVPLVAAVAVLIFGLMLARATRHGNPVQPANAGAVGTSGVAERKVAPPAADAGPAAVPAASAQGEAIVLDIRPTASTWVTAHADGKRVVYRELKGGEQTIVKARDEIALRIGNVGAFDYSIDGKPGRTLGRPGEVRNVRITRNTVPSFRR